MSAKSEELLRLGAASGARLVALERIAAVDGACRRMDEEDDEEGLHRFRVAVRRLRTYLSAYSAYLPVGKKVKEGLRSLAKATNAARDAEVAAAWLRGQRDGLGRSHRVVVDGLLRELEQERRGGYEAARGQLSRRWRTLGKKLGKRLAEMGDDGRSAGPGYAQASAALVVELGDAVDQGLRQLQAHWDDGTAHRTRIKGKRLRYVVEALGVGVEGAEETIQSLKVLQDCLGEINDSRVFMQWVGISGEVAAARRARRLLELAVTGEVNPSLLRTSRWRDPVPGLLALVGLARERHRTLRGDLDARYFHGGREALHGQVQGLAKRLRLWNGGDAAPLKA